MPDATCKLCEPYKKVTKDGIGCEYPTCEKRDKYTKNGKCSLCPPYTIPDK